ncbi:hypothetical protein HB820_02785 [Listeria booriae]|uniref:hypothetical protein n=1 Tax=Listeria booriae TaxID=1552123 RepID=UPI001627D4BB|nr:hypothetical protein [Listeria booriae]MBC1334207.1 hypothetical protein [Listeria booriae]
MRNNVCAFGVGVMFSAFGSSFTRQPFGAFTASAKTKRRFLLRLLQALSGLNGRVQLCCGSYEASFAELEPQYA